MVEARINLDWLDDTEYHRFLIWIVRNISGTDGWNNLQEGQVRFSRRDVELKLGVSSSKATYLTRKAVCDGLLNPLKMHSKRKGMGEVYDTLGDLKGTRFWLEPSLNQDRTKIEPSNQLNQDNLGSDLNQDRTKIEPSLNRLIDIKEEKKEKKESKRGTSPSAPSSQSKTVEKPNKLKDILEWNDMDYYEVFWKVLEPFPKEKKTWPQTIATVFMDAVRSGTEPEAIYNAALSLSKSTNPQYMPNAAKWLKEEGWLAYANR